VWFEDQLNSGERVGLPWFTLVSFLRLSSQKSVRPNPLTVLAASEFVEDWLEWDTVWTPHPTERHSRIMSDLLKAVPRSSMVNDAHLAALAIEHGLTLCSADRGFSMFPGLKFRNPLE
jgi:toxin-antitoxin system PIN domain toxin